VLLINRRYVRGSVNRAGNDLFIQAVLDEWDQLRIEKDSVVAFVSDEYEGSFRILSAIRCPGGEQEAWAILRRTGPLPKGHITAKEARTSYAVRFDRAPMLSA
jgi:hypothetical protein